MTITPADIENRTFGIRFRGFDRQETRTFLAEVSEEMVVLAAELQRLRQENEQLRQAIEGWRGRESEIHQTLYSVRGLAEQLRKQAHEEAEGIEREARLSAERTLQLAREQVIRLEEEISYLRLERNAFADWVRLAAEEHLRVIESRREEGEVRDRLRLLSRRHHSAAEPPREPARAQPAELPGESSAAPGGPDIARITGPIPAPDIGDA